jgi:spore photoproduct lyase
MYAPEHIFVYEGVKKNRRTEELLSRFPKTKVSYIDDQSPNTVRRYIDELYGKPERLADVIDMSKKMLVVGTGTKVSFVDKFVNEWDCICPSFYSITPLSNGCYYNCEFCYLQLTYRGIYPYIKVNVNLDDLNTAIKSTVRKEQREHPGRRVNFNCGEKLDSLAFNDYFNTTDKLLPLFEEKGMENAELLLLTKSACVDKLIEYAKKKWAPKNVIVSWSLNGERTANEFEHGAPKPRERMLAAKRCQDAGYRIRLRIDPMICRKGWEEDYRALIKEVADLKIEPEIVTLGSLRFDNGLPGISCERFKKSKLFDYRFIIEGKDKQRYRTQHRVEMYKLAIKELSNRFSERGLRLPEIGLCKEKAAVWKESGLSLKEGACNCCGVWNPNAKTEPKKVKTEPDKPPKKVLGFVYSNCVLPKFHENKN